MNKYFIKWYSRTVFNFQPPRIKQLFRKLENKSKQQISNNLHQEFNKNMFKRKLAAYLHIYIYVYVDCTEYDFCDIMQNINKDWRRKIRQPCCKNSRNTVTSFIEGGASATLPA